MAIPTLPGWEKLPLRDLLSREFNRFAVLESDGIAAAFGERRHGAGQGLRNLVYLTTSTGIGGGVVVDGHLLHGRRGMAGHVEHLPLDPAGPACSCEASGCFEALTSGSAFARAARWGVAEAPSTLLAATPSDILSMRGVSKAAWAGDAVSSRLIADRAHWIGQGVIALLHAYSPSAVTLGGGVAQAFDLLEAGIMATIRARALPAFQNVIVVRAALGEDSGLIGAPALADEACDVAPPLGG